MYASPDPPNRVEDATTFNNVYKPGVEEGRARLAKSVRTRSWTVDVDGLVYKPRSFAIDELTRLGAPRGVRLCPSLCGGVVHGDPVDRVSRQRPAERVGADGQAKY
jgi:hypothetical protein